MKNSPFYFFIIILIIAWITNPDDLQKHQDAVVSFHKEKYLNLGDGANGQAHIDKILKNIENSFNYAVYWLYAKSHVDYENYYFFSLTTISNQVVGVGIFGKVLVFELEPPQDINSNCVRCGGDGKISKQELDDFLLSDVLSDAPTIKYFQDWMDKHQPFWIRKSNNTYNLSKGTPEAPERHLGGAGYGQFGPATSKAYKIYKDKCFSISHGKKNCLLCSVISR